MNEPPSTFEIAVSRNFAKGMSRGESVRRAAQEYPVLHKKYLQRLAAGDGCFLNEVLTIGSAVREYNKSSALQRSFETVAAYVRKCMSGQKGRTRK